MNHWFFSLIAKFLFVSIAGSIMIGTRCVSNSPSYVTIGNLSSKSSDYRDCRLRISNAASGDIRDRFVVFAAKIPTRHNIVLAFAEGFESAEPSCEYSGYCVGVIDHTIPSVPCDCPFVYVIQVKPEN